MAHSGTPPGRGGGTGPPFPGKNLPWPVPQAAGCPHLAPSPLSRCASEGSSHLPSLRVSHLDPSPLTGGGQASSGSWAPRAASPSVSDQPGFSLQLNPQVANAGEVDLLAGPAAAAGGRGGLSEAVRHGASVHVGLQGFQELLGFLFGG